VALVIDLVAPLDVSFLFPFNGPPAHETPLYIFCFLLLNGKKNLLRVTDTTVSGQKYFHPLNSPSQTIAKHLTPFILTAIRKRSYIFYIVHYVEKTGYRSKTTPEL
jgi:hypothetical protein